MFDKKIFSSILQKINSTYTSMTEFAKRANFDRTYISKYINMKLDNPPTPKILSKIADASNGIIDYTNLMTVCGYISHTGNNDAVQALSSYIANNNYDYLYTSFKKLLSLQLNDYEFKNVIKTFTDCCQYIMSLDDGKKLTDFTSTLSPKEKKGFNCLYIALLKRLRGLSNVPRGKNELFNINKNMILKNNEKDKKEVLSIIDGFKNSIFSFYEKHLKDTFVSQYYMAPVYGRISAGQPNWVEECIEGRIPIDIELMNIVNPEECFFLRVNGESMNKLIKNGAYALIRKTDVVDDGDIAVVLVNGYDATLKKFSKQGEFIALEPMSTDPNFKMQIYAKDTEIKILGKYIGKMEMK